MAPKACRSKRSVHGRRAIWSTTTCKPWTKRAARKKNPDRFGRGETTAGDESGDRKQCDQRVECGRVAIAYCLSLIAYHLSSIATLDEDLHFIRWFVVLSAVKNPRDRALQGIRMRGF